MRAIILAAGEGIRLRPLTTYMPKVMLPVGNKPILEYIIESLRENSIKDITMVVGYKSDKIKQYFGNGSDFGVHIDYVEQKKQLGTAHALYQARIEEEFLLFFGDNIVGEKCVKELLNTKINTIIGAHSNKTSAYGIVEDVDGRIKIVRSSWDGEAIAFTGMGHFDSEIFRIIEGKMKEGIYNLPEILNEMNVNLRIANCEWKDAIYPWDLIELNSYSLRRNVRKLAGKIEESTIIGNVEIGENTRIGAGSYIRGNVKIGKNCEIGPNCVIIGDTSIGDGVRIGALSYVENSLIMNDTSIGEGAYLKDSVIGREAWLGVRFTGLSGRTRKIMREEVIDINGGIIVGDGAYIGSSVIINPGLVVGSNAKIEALKVLKDDVANGERVV